MVRQKQLSRRRIAQTEQEGQCLTAPGKPVVLSIPNEKKTRKARVLQLPGAVKRCLRKCWMDGEVWNCDQQLSSLLGITLKEATNADEPIPAEEWCAASRRCNEWTCGENKGPKTAAGSFQRALLSERTLVHEKHVKRGNIVSLWLRVIPGLPQARVKHNVGKMLSTVDDAAATQYIIRLNHDLARTNNHKKKQDAKGRQKWYELGSAQDEEEDNKTSDQEAGDNTDHVLEAVVDKKFDVDDNCVLYRCRWVGFAAEEDTWEPLSNLGEENPEIARFLVRQAEIEARKATETNSPEIVDEPPNETRKRKKSKAPKSGKTPRKSRKDLSTPITNKRPSTDETSKAPRKRGKAETRRVDAKDSKQADKLDFGSYAATKMTPDTSRKDLSTLVPGSGIWVEYYDGTSNKEWYKAKIIIVSSTTEVPSAQVVRVQFEDKQKATLNLKGLEDAHKLEQHNPDKFEVFDWSSDKRHFI